MDKNSQSFKQDIVALSTRYSILSTYTSFIAVEVRTTPTEATMVGIDIDSTVAPEDSKQTNNNNNSNNSNSGKTPPSQRRAMLQQSLNKKWKGATQTAKKQWKGLSKQVGKVKQKTAGKLSLLSFSLFLSSSLSLLLSFSLFFVSLHSFSHSCIEIYTLITLGIWFVS